MIQAVVDWQHTTTFSNCTGASHAVAMTTTHIQSKAAVYILDLNSSIRNLEFKRGRLSRVFFLTLSTMTIVATHNIKLK